MIDGNARSAGVAGVNYPASSQEQQSGGLGGGYFFWPVLLGLIWTFMVIVVNPLGNFPLNDDWAYGYSVRALVENAQIRFSDWTATNLFGQVLWGALFCLPFGFSFTALRFSTAVLGFVGVLATYGILRELKTSRATAAIGALTLAFCPIYFALSLTFMNDVPFAAFAISSLYFFLRGLRLDSSLTIAVGLVLAGVAILTRQYGLALPIAYAGALLVKKGVHARYLLLALFVVVTGVVIQVAYQTWLFKRGLAPARFNDQVFSLLAQTRQGPRQLLRDGAEISFFCLMYLGLFITPVLPFVILKSQRDARLSRRTSLLVTAFIAVLLVGGLIWVGKLMPLWRNILDKGGIGPYPMIRSEILLAPRLFWVAVTGLSLVGSAGMLKGLFSAGVALYSRLRKRSARYHPWNLALLFSVIVVSFAPLPLLGLGDSGFYDRYVLIFVPIIIALLADGKSRKKADFYFFASCTSWYRIVTYSVSLQSPAPRLYLALNRTRWKALQDLMRERNIPASHIYAGLDFGGWYFYNRQFSKDRTRTWFWVEKDDYIVPFNLQNNYEIDRRYPVQRWLPWRQGAGEVIVQRRTAGEPRWIVTNVSLPTSLQFNRRYGKVPVRFGRLHTSLFSS